MLLIFNRQVSSGKWKVDEFNVAILRSLIKIKKSKGPKTDSCGTPHSLGWWSKSNPLTETDWDLLLITQVRLKANICNTSYSIIVEFY